MRHLKPVTLSLLCLMLLRGEAGPSLNTLIRQNLAAARTTYGQLAKPVALGPQLWIHVRSQTQMALMQGNLAWFRSLHWKGQPIDIRPVEVVSYGPNATELRFFKPEDQSPTTQLQQQMASRIPQLQINNRSAAYRQATWLKSGHLELWLAPGLTQLGPPR